MASSVYASPEPFPTILKQDDLFIRKSKAGVVSYAPRRVTLIKNGARVYVTLTQIQAELPTIFLALTSSSTGGSATTTR